MDSRESQLAEAVRQACLTAAVEAAERGGMVGLCADGRLEAALDAIRALRIDNGRLGIRSGIRVGYSEDEEGPEA